MILGKLFKKIFEAKIKVIFSSNIKISMIFIKMDYKESNLFHLLKFYENNSYENELIN